MANSTTPDFAAWVADLERGAAIPPLDDTELVLDLALARRLFATRVRATPPPMTQWLALAGTLDTAQVPSGSVVPASQPTATASAASGAAMAAGSTNAGLAGAQFLLLLAVAVVGAVVVAIGGRVTDSGTNSGTSPVLAPSPALVATRIPSLTATPTPSHPGIGTNQAATRSSMPSPAPTTRHGAFPASPPQGLPTLGPAAHEAPTERPVGATPESPATNVPTDDAVHRRATQRAHVTATPWPGLPPQTRTPRSPIVSPEPTQMPPPPATLAPVPTLAPTDLPVSTAEPAPLPTATP
jgi:hypothetical protein